jgi:hypothetical protein
MPITEFVILHLLHPHSFQSGGPEEIFRTLDIWQSESSTYPLYFYADKSDSSTIYLISGWHDVDAHMRWIASNRNQELLRVSKPFLEVKSMVHLGIDFTTMPNDCDVVMVKKRGVHDADGGSGSIEDENVHSLASSPAWIGVGEDLEPGSETVYQMSAGYAQNGFGTHTQLEREVMTMKRLYVSQSGQNRLLGV